MSKRLFLGCYDYGMGGLWALIQARSAEEIVQKFPCLTVWEGLPDWQIGRSAEDGPGVNSMFDIDHDPPKWLIAALAKGSSKPEA